jgi:N-acylglucosamine 2-epimerase
MSSGDLLRDFGAHCRANLTQSVVPFWYEHSIDREYGGFYSGLDRDGSVYDDRKYVWLQGRAIWMFARLYNNLEPRPEWRQASVQGLEFLRAHGRDPQGRPYFSLTRQGEPFFFQRKPYAAVFYLLALVEFHRMTGDEECLSEARELFWRIVQWINDPALLDRPSLSGQPAMSSLANVMVLASMAIELIQVDPDQRYLQVMVDAVAGARRHFEPQHRILVENAPLEAGRLPENWPEARFFNPGHSIEVAWFLLHLLDHVKDAGCRDLALDVLEGSLELGWDDGYGGLYYFMDTGGRPTLQLESSMKLWWPHTEALYALVLAYDLTRDQRWLSWLERVDRYTRDHFVDTEYGGWFGYCDRRGELTHTCKGGSYKGFFHVPRALLMCLQRVEAMGLA